MIRALILTEWVGGTHPVNDPYEPRVIRDYRVSFQDATGNPFGGAIATNLFAAWIECDAATFNQIDADTNYVVIWSENA